MYKKYIKDNNNLFTSIVKYSSQMHKNAFDVTLQDYDGEFVRARRGTDAKTLIETYSTSLYTVIGDAVGITKRPDKFLLVRCNVCQWKRNMNINDLKLKSQRCLNCVKIRLNAEAGLKNLTLIGAATKPTRRLYRFNKCGHTQEISTGDVRDRVPLCKTCYENTLHLQAANADLVYVSKSDRGGIYLNYKLPCGHYKDFRKEQVKKKSWFCDDCNENYYQKPSFIYLLKISCNGFTWLKLGFSKNIRIRTNSYQLDGDYTSEVLHLSEYNTGLEAFRIEKALHAYFKQHRLDNKLMKQYHKRNGFTECYPVALEAELLFELTKIKEKDAT